MSKARDIASAAPAPSTVSATEIGYLDGVTSGIQTQIDGKQAANAAVSTTELGYLDGVTSSIQTQLNQKPEYVAGKNFVLNGGFDIWQRGTTFTNPTDGTYTADRWVIDSGGGTNSTITQQTTGTPSGTRYVYRVTQTGTANKTIAQLMETSTAAAFWGKTVVASVYLRRNATQTGDLGLNVYKSSTVDAGRGATWTSIGSVTVSNATLPTGTTSADWYRAIVSFSVPNDGTANSIKLTVGDAANNPNGAIWEMSAVQLEVGSTATSFARSGGTIQGELATCQRYFWRAGGDSVADRLFGSGIMVTTTTARHILVFPVQMRTPSTISPSAASTFYLYGGAGAQIPTAVNVSAITQQNCTVDATRSASTIGQASMLQAVGTANAYIDVSGEL